MDTERATIPAVAPVLAAACSSLAVGTGDDAVAGVVPAFVAAPASTQEAADLLRAAAAAGLAVVPRGAGTGFGWGSPPSRCDLVNRRRPGAHDERSVQQLVPAAVIGYPVQLGDGERAAGRRPGLGDRHDTHGASFCA